MEQQQEKKVLLGFVGCAAKKGCQVNVFLQSGIRLVGYIGDYDESCLILTTQPKKKGRETAVPFSSIGSIAESRVDSGL